jgi:hypothetical protein
MPDTLPLLKQPRVYIPIAILFFVAVGVNAFVFFKGPKLFSQMFSLTPTPTPDLRPIKEIPSGRQIYNVSNGSNVVGPKMQKIILDPQTPTPQEKQTVTITVKNNSPLTEAMAYIKTDNRELGYPLTLIEGTKTDSTWQGSWKISDTYDHTYSIRFDLKSSTGEYNDSIVLRQ